NPPPRHDPRPSPRPPRARRDLGRGHRTELTPWYRATVASDHDRLAEINALRAGLEPPPPTDPAGAVRQRFRAPPRATPTSFAALLEIIGVLTPPAAIFARPGLTERVLELTHPAEQPTPPGPPPTASVGHG